MNKKVNQIRPTRVIEVVELIEKIRAEHPTATLRNVFQLLKSGKAYSRLNDYEKKKIWDEPDITAALQVFVNNSNEDDKQLFEKSSDMNETVDRIIGDIMAGKTYNSSEGDNEELETDKNKGEDENMENYIKKTGEDTTPKNIEEYFKSESGEEAMKTEQTGTKGEENKSEKTSPKKYNGKAFIFKYKKAVDLNETIEVSIGDKDGNKESNKDENWKTIEGVEYETKDGAEAGEKKSGIVVEFVKKLKMLQEKESESFTKLVNIIKEKKSLDLDDLIEEMDMRLFGLIGVIMAFASKSNVEKHQIAQYIVCTAEGLYDYAVYESDVTGTDIVVSGNVIPFKKKEEIVTKKTEDYSHIHFPSVKTKLEGMAKRRALFG